MTTDKMAASLPRCSARPSPCSQGLFAVFHVVSNTATFLNLFGIQSALLNSAVYSNFFFSLLTAYSRGNGTGNLKRVRPPDVLGKISGCIVSLVRVYTNFPSLQFTTKNLGDQTVLTHLVNVAWTNAHARRQVFSLVGSIQRGNEPKHERRRRKFR